MCIRDRCQILLDRTKMLPGRIIVTLVCTGAVLSFLGLYDPFAEYAGAGASVPLLGFGHLLFQGVKDEMCIRDSYMYSVAGFDIYASWVAVAVIVAFLITLINVLGAKTAAVLQTVLTCIIGGAGILLIVARCV